jgi:hypothetical protein
LLLKVKGELACFSGKYHFCIGSRLALDLGLPSKSLYLRWLASSGGILIHISPISVYQTCIHNPSCWVRNTVCRKYRQNLNFSFVFPLQSRTKVRQWCCTFKSSKFLCGKAAKWNYCPTIHGPKLKNGHNACPWPAHLVLYCIVLQLLAVGLELGT